MSESSARGSESSIGGGWRWIAGLALFLLWGLGVEGSTPEGRSDSTRPLTGLPLIEVLEELRSGGLDLFFTSRLVRPDMRVVSEPTTTEPRYLLIEVLAPHGLSISDGPGGRLVIVEGPPPPSAIRGLVRARETLEPIAGVRLVLGEPRREAFSGADGTFAFDDLVAGEHSLDARLPGFVVAHTKAKVPVGRSTEIVIELDVAPVALDEIVVTPSRMSLLGSEPGSGFDLDADDIFALPHLSDDIFRALTLLPGVTGEEVSARFHVRGGRADEVLVLLDSVELFEPYHMKDYSSSLSIIAPRALREVKLITGGFPARYGDRMSGVLDMSTQQPVATKYSVGVGLLISEIAGSGKFGDRRGHWLASFRRGSPEYALDFLGKLEKPRYWDAFAKVSRQPQPTRTYSLHALHSDDSLDYFNIDPDTEETYRTSYGNAYFWVGHQEIVNDRLFFDTVLSIGRVERDRRGNEVEPGEDPLPEAAPLPSDEGEGSSGGEEPEEGADEEEELPEAFTLRDERQLDVRSLKQDWSFHLADHHHLAWGFEARELVTDYDYANVRVLEDPLEAIRSEPRTGTTRLRTRIRGEQYSIYFTDRFRPRDDFTLELGLRYDEQDLIGDRHLSPRLNLVRSTAKAGTFRLAWGYFYQSQRPYELQVEDGISRLAAAERTEQRVLGWEKALVQRWGVSNLSVRVEAYHRIVSDPRPRYENIFEPISIYPEIEPDRVLFAPQESEAYGIELFVRGSLGSVDWWTSYTYSKTEDSIDGRWVPRRIDQPHALTLDFEFRLSEDWRLNLAWRFHTGWPTTAVMGMEEIDDEGEAEIVPVLGPLNAERLPDYHRLDLRASREWQKTKGTLGLFIEVQNVYDHENTAGFDVDFEFLKNPDGSIAVLPVEEVWGGFLPSFGITWDF